MPPVTSRADARAIHDAHRLMLGRDATPQELASFAGGSVQQVIDAVLGSAEFRPKQLAFLDPDAPAADDPGHEAALRQLGANALYVDRLYLWLIGRTPDESGRSHYVGALDRGDTRVSVLRSFVRSDEFDQRYVQTVPFIPRDVQLCELANPAKWDNPDWMALLRDMHIPALEKWQMHRKAYEFGQLGFGLRRLGQLRDDAAVLSVGAGHEEILYWFANTVARIVGVDMYGRDWQDGSRGLEGDDSVVVDPSRYAPFAYRRDRLTLLKMDGRHLAFADGTFDAAYSLSSIEHFGGLDGAIAAVGEMGRVVRRGGIVAVATEYHLSGPPHPEVFTPAEVQALFDRPGLRLVEPIDDAVYRRYDFVPINLDRNPYQTPHMVVKIGDTVFTSVMEFLQKL